MLTGKFARQGYDWWWHSMTGINEETGEEKSFFVEYYVCNPKLAQDIPVFGQLPKNKESGIKPSYLMVKVGAWGEDGVQVHRFFPWKDVDIHFKTPFSVRADDCFCSETEMKGSAHVSKEESEAHPEYLCEYGDFEWNIKISPKIAFNVGYGAGRFFRALKAFQMFWHAEGMKCLYDGYIKFNGTKYSVTPDKCWGYTDKNWGSDFTTPWVWLSSCDLVSRITGKRLENSAFDIGGGRPKIGPIALDRKLLGAIFYEGKNYEFNFSKPWTMSKTNFNCYETDTQIIWHVEQKASGASLVTDITCEKKDMIFIKYEAPDGQMRHRRLWNGGNGVGILKLYDGNNLIDEIEAKHVGCEYGEYDKITPYVSMTK